MISILLSSLLRMSFKSSITFNKSLYSALNLSCSKPVNCLNLISTIALDWRSDNLNLLINFSLASSGLFEPLIKAITSSILSEAIIKPSNICALSSAFLSSNLDLLITTSCRWSTKWTIKSFKFKTTGLPFTKAMLLTENEVCKDVYLNNLFKTTLGIASLLISYTILIPFLSDSSLISEIPTNLPSFTKAAVFCIISALFTWYGISVTIIASLFSLISSIVAFALITILPFPSWKAFFTPS